ncbi:Transcriptional regulatory protein RXT2 [Nakaseomyces bracarensis]|uniref:Transcriptional regulatory protein RXT2 n=1 Tax=Nakaseomyces bracarensis TaxID=273131 RepID=A0ABR4P028_9SACH
MTKEIKESVKRTGRGRKSKEDVASLQQEMACINAFTRRVLKEKAGNYRPLKRASDGSFVFPHASGITTNRGNKLLQGIEQVSRNMLDTSKPLAEEKIFYNGSEHSLLQSGRKRMKFPSVTYDQSLMKLEEESANDEDMFDEIESLSKLVNVRELLTPIASLSDVCKRSASKRTFDNNILSDLALHCILMIEREQNSVTKYSKLLDVFLGDYPTPLYERNINLKDYDHSLTLKEEDLEDGSQLEALNAQDEKNRKSKSNEIQVNMFTRKIPTHTYDMLLREKNETNDIPDANSLIGEDDDPFFAVPTPALPESFKTLLPETASPHVLEEVENTRQLVQIALQRNQEFIRNLQKIRGFLVKCNRIRERIQAWSREYANVPEDGVTVPNALRVVKRGLISATTNRSMSTAEGMDELGREEEEEEIQQQ